MTSPSAVQTSLFENSNNVTIKHSQFTQNIGSVYYNGSSQIALDRLQNAVAPGAFHNSGERFPPPQCHPGTRLKVTQHILDWIYGRESTESLIMWLNGGAGAGKSAIAQWIAEQCHEANILLACYFASNRADPRRKDANYIIPTIAYQLARTIPEARSRIIEEITRDPLIFTQSLEAQMIALIVRPLQLLVNSGFFADPLSSPRLVIIDGLDEISDYNAQVKVLEVICSILQQHHTPLIFLIASRPEQEISHAFSLEPLSIITGQLLLDQKYDPDHDIQLFLSDKISRIKNSHQHKNTLPSDWPPRNTIAQLVIKASGHFIYASTVVCFVESPRHRPADRLDIILGLCPMDSSSPFSELDALYMQILSVQNNWDQIRNIIGVLFTYQGFPAGIETFHGMEEFLGLRTGDAGLYLADITSLISWDPGPNGEQYIRILHASFHDFLLDHTRSGRFTIDIKAMHTMMAYRCIQQLIDHSKQNFTKFSEIFLYSLRSTGFHISNGHPDENLMDLLKTVAFQDILHNCQTGLKRDFGLIWTSIYDLVIALSTSGFDQSEYHNLRNQHLDQVLKNELDMQYSRHPSLPFILCLWMTYCTTNAFTGAGQRQFNNFNCLMQLTGWYGIAAPKGLTTQKSKWPAPIFLLFENLTEEIANILYDFFHDTSRSGSYAVTSESYANASVSCLKYLCSARLGPPINLHHTSRNLARRRNFPWHWNRYKKLISRLPILYRKSERSTTLPNRWRVSGADRRQASSMCENLEEQCERHRKYLDTTRLGLDFLYHALPISASSNMLISLLRAEKSFSHRAVALPNRFKKCQTGIAAYLAQVDLTSKPRPPTSATNAETELSNNKLEFLPASEEGVLLHDQDLGLSERWFAWVAQSKKNGEDEQDNGRQDGWENILKFLLPIILSFIISAISFLFFLGNT